MHIEGSRVAGWRLKWSLKELKASKFAQHRRALQNPLAFYWALLLKFVPSLWPRPLVLTLRDGSRTRVHEFTTLYIYEEIFVDHCYDIELGGVERPNVLDVGANTGLFALRMKQLFPTSRVVCFEPFPPNFDRLTETIRINDLSNVTPIRKGIGGRSRRERLYVHPKNIGGHSIFPNIASSHDYVEIELVDLAAALRELNGRCEILKLDCEGAEKEIIESITPDVASNIARIVFEPTGTSREVHPTLEKLNSLGYVVHNRHRLFWAERAI